MVATANRAAPFQVVANPYTAPLQALTYDNGTRSPVPLRMRPDGYVERISLLVSDTVTYATAGPTGTDSYASLAGIIDRIEIVNAAISDLYNLTGEFAALFTILNRLYVMNNATAGSLVAFTASPGTTATTNTWQFDIDLAVNMDLGQGTMTPIGLYPAGFLGAAPVINVYQRPIVSTAGNPGSGVYSGNPGNLTSAPGTIDASQYGYAPVPAGSEPPGNLVRRFREGSIAINGNQAYEIQLLQGAFYGRIILIVVAGSATSVPQNINTIARLQFEFGAQSIQYDWNQNQIQAYMARTFSNVGLPNYVFVLDLYTNTRNMMRWVNSAAMTQPRILITLQNIAGFSGAQNMVRWAAEEFAPTKSVAARAA